MQQNLSMVDLIRKRRSIRSFKKDPVPPEMVGVLIESLLRAPSSRNINPWEFIVVDDHQLLQQLSTAKEHGSAFLKGAPLGIVVCADCRKTDVWVEDCSIASILLQMTAESLGLGSCWIQIRLRSHDRSKTSEEFIREVLALPDYLKVESIISIGFPNEKRAPLAADSLQHDKVMHNGYASSYISSWSSK